MHSFEQHRRTIGVLTGWRVYESTVPHSFLASVIDGIRAAAHDRGCNLMVACGTGDPFTDPSALRTAWPVPSPGIQFVPVGPTNADGLILVTPLSSEAHSRYIQGLIRDGYPVVFTGTAEPGPSVGADNEGGIRQALAHLMAHGHRRIAFISGPEVEVEGDSGRRLKAYEAAIREWGLAFDPDLIASGHHTRQGGREAVAHILAKGKPFTAVLASNDDSAIGALDGLRDAGLLVPQDVAVIGFDDRPEARAQVPPLTTVRYPQFESGYQALALLLQRIEGLVEEEEAVRVPTRLLVRESCGCLPGVTTGVVFEEATQQGKDRDQLSPGIIGPIAKQMAAAIHTGMHRLRPDEVEYLCQRLVEAFRLSLEQDDATVFRLTTRQILQRVSSLGDDLHAWQAAVSILQEGMSALVEASSHRFTRQQVEQILHQARVAISEATWVHHTRRQLHQADIADGMGRMTAQFLAAHHETTVFKVLAESMPSIGIPHVAVAFYEQERDDPVAWSVLQTPSGLDASRCRFPSREFPPEGLYPDQKPFSLALLPLLIGENLFGFVAFDAGNLGPCADIVRQLSAALRGVWLYREAVEGRRLAEEANRLKSRFLSMVSHELRTPLNLITGLSDVLLREGEQTESGELKVKQEDVKRIYASAQHLDGLIQDVSDLARSEIDQLKLVREALNMAEVLRTAAMIGEPLAHDKGLVWRAEIPEDLPLVWGDRTRLQQVALNLVNNAVKFTAQGEVTLVAKAECGNVTVEVRDSGLGIPTEEQQVIFDEFRQSERTTARGYGGLGLGLAICRRLVEMHGGEIGVHSGGEVGSGSAFYFTLPTMVQQSISSNAHVAWTQAQQVLLLVKDPDSGETLRHHLMQQGTDVQMHQVDRPVADLWQLCVGTPEAVVLDLGLASACGWQILKTLKENPATQDVPVLFYTLSHDQDSSSVLEMGYLTKPVGTAELADILAHQVLLHGSGNGTQKRILIVDDEPGTLEMYTQIVEAQLADCQVWQARDGREALDVIQREKPDLVLLDLMMPELDGFGVLEIMQEQETSRNIPVIVLSGQTLTEEDMARLNQGVASVLGKGVFSVEETLGHIKAALAQREKLGSEAQRVVRKALAYMHTHYAEPISRGDVASYVGLSERHLTRRFGQAMGVTPINYLNRYRIRQAKALLEEGEKNITEVAMEVGFSDSSYFARVFRHEAGIAPRAYQRGARESEKC